MQDTHLRFHSSNGKRLVLVVEDEIINREILSNILSDTYELLFAENGQEALEAIHAHFDTLSLVLLDLVLPDIHGMDILKSVKEAPELSRIPVIVMTSDRESEVDSLTFGASDFISKPYPMPKVIRARVRRTIELSEDRAILRQTERDSLTGLLNREFFYRYAEQYDMYHKDQTMDAIVMDVNHFHLLNERHGKAFGDHILQQIAAYLKEMILEYGGLVCRLEADTFLIYCPHRTDYQSILDTIGAYLGEDSRSLVRLRMGVYSEVDKTIDIERRFDRAKMAADTVRSSFAKAVAIYDNALHESEIYAEQLLEGFKAAIDEKQFVVFYQPKFDIQTQEPVLHSAEALVRWKHPTLGMISPSVFIPLFEKNGLIQVLDRYIWRQVAEQIQDWKTRLHFCVPVSVNVSRIDMLDSQLVESMEQLVTETGLTHADLHLEITESAYTQDAVQIIETVNRFRDKGFTIEMDDFGSGYSSLNMVSTLPIDALKLDMQFIRNAFSERKDTRMLEVVFDIADSLNVPTIAEGVETAEQMFTLKAMGCDVVQGYYFSRPIPPEEFESFLVARQKIGPVEHVRSAAVHVSPSRKVREKFTYNALHDATTGMYNHSGFEMLYHDADKEHIALLVFQIVNLRDLPMPVTNQVVLRVADVLRQSFRSVDLICRLQEDEFVVIVTRVTTAMQALVCEKVAAVSEALSMPMDNLPGIDMHIGIAFSDPDNPEADLLHRADMAISELVREGTSGYRIYQNKADN